MKPLSRRLEANGLSQHVLIWNNDARGDISIVLLHGFLDLAWSFERVAERLAKHYHVVAPDFRGHGDTDWVGRGGYYYFPDYTADLARLLPQVTRKKVYLVGHSMGGMVATYYTGTFPERVQRLALLEGVGPPHIKSESAPDRLLKYIETVDEIRAHPPAALATIEEATQRLIRRHPRLDPNWAQRLAELATRPANNGNPGNRVWKFDPLHRTRSPLLFQEQQFAAFTQRITCPVMLVNTELSELTFMHDTKRHAYYPNPRVETLAGAGHMLHLDQPQAVAELLLDFFGSAQ